LYYVGLLLGGFRRGELLAVEWQQVDFITGGISVEKQISLDEAGRATEAELKTEESEAFVPMPRWYMSELEKFKRVWAKEKLKMDPKEWIGGDKQYVFHSGFGDKYYPNTASRRWQMFIDANKLPRIRLHDLRQPQPISTCMSLN
jgi:integrase